MGFLSFWGAGAGIDTGATGAHFHIGKDKVAQKFLGQKGFKFPLVYSYDDPNEYYDYENLNNFYNVYKLYAVIRQ